MFGRVVDLQPLGQTPRFLGWVSGVETGDAVGVELVHDQHDLLSGRVEFVAESLDDGGKVLALTLGAHKDVALACQWLADHEQGRRAVARVLPIDALGAARTHGQRRTHFARQLFGRLVQIDLRAGHIVGPLVHRQHILHRGDEFGVRLGRDAPTLL